jgi:2-keto-4-pentenoate hydratase/2-oxohepta-3-ene-1,7-dioic acid hydratase in catechol pathway
LFSFSSGFRSEAIVGHADYYNDKQDMQSQLLKRLACGPEETQLRIITSKDGTVWRQSVDDGPWDAVTAGSLDAAIPAGDPGLLERTRSASTPTDQLELAPPVSPGKIIAIGLNYLDHIREAGVPSPTSPLVFAKFPSSLTGHGAEIVIDRSQTDRVDWEVELAVVIGRPAHRVGVERALDHVFGYTIANDVSARDVQFADGQWVRGKSFDTFCPIGPDLVTADEIPDPQALPLCTRVNGTLVQDSNTAEMVFGVAELISFCSFAFRLEPGDLLLTGTPWGCGEFMDPPRSLRPGDRVDCTVGGIGTLTNHVIDLDG